MNFSDKLNAEFSNFGIKSPNTQTTHMWHLEYLHADFIELKALFWSANSWLTLQDVIGHYKDYNEKIENSDDSVDTAAINDEWNSKFLEYFQLIKYRKQDLQDLYPFDVEETRNYLKLKGTLNSQHIVYLAMLISSNLENFPVLESILTKDFEKLSKITMERYFTNSIVLELGKNSGLKGNTIDKIKKISTELNIKYRDEEVNKLSRYASQEKGLDLLAYKPFGDKIASMITILAQCACGKNWVSKTNETKSYEDFLDFYKLSPIHSMFIPYYISSENGFNRSYNLHNRLVFERKRILEFLDDFDFFNVLETKQIVEKCIIYDGSEV